MGNGNHSSLKAVTLCVWPSERNWRDVGGIKGIWEDGRFRRALQIWQPACIPTCLPAVARFDLSPAGRSVWLWVLLMVLLPARSLGAPSSVSDEDSPRIWLSSISHDCPVQKRWIWLSSPLPGLALSTTPLRIPFDITCAANAVDGSTKVAGCEWRLWEGWDSVPMWLLCPNAVLTSQRKDTVNKGKGQDLIWNRYELGAVRDAMQKLFLVLTVIASVC